MSRHPRPLVAGNWKMHGFRASLAEIAAMRRAVEAGAAGAAEVLVCPPSTLIVSAAALLAGGPVLLGAQNCHPGVTGAYTGDISAPMLADAGATHVIVGHSERRGGYGESDAMARAKAQAAIEAGLTAIVCVGETKGERETGAEVEVVCRQLHGSLPPGATGANLVVAYEPVWAIGAGVTPTTGQVAAMHAAARAELVALYGAEAARIRILYGGSVKPSNARELLGLANVDGALVGGASLKADDFIGIAAAYA
ncbi:MAG: triose-phosphate isomerase [Roseiarcus sp.]|jgi:triosephosphate isomerase